MSEGQQCGDTGDRHKQEERRSVSAGEGADVVATQLPRPERALLNAQLCSRPVHIWAEDELYVSA